MANMTHQEMQIIERLRDAQPWADPVYSADDIGNSRLFADFFVSTARFVEERKCWYVYDGRVWQADRSGVSVMEKCKLLARLMPAAAVFIRDRFDREHFLERAMSWSKRSVREKIIKDAAGVHMLQMSDFDVDPLLFNCQNGTLDLRDFTFHPHTPDDLITMMSGAEYRADAYCERWEQFVDEVMQPACLPPPEQTTIVPDEGVPGGVPPMVQKKLYLQQALGYALTGQCQHECMFILHGATTRNGKGTMMESILRMMGDYGKTAMPETIGTRPHHNSSAPREDVARLRGARFVNISEPDRRLTLSAALVKQLTGCDTITARFLHENSFEFKPQFKMFVNTNYLPQITDMTLFSSGRIKIIPFERHFEPDEQDHTLKELFAQPENLSAILNWCLLGLNALRELGFDEPPAILSATDRYRRDSDKVAQFVEEMLVEDAQGEIKTADLYRLYQSWCEQNGYLCENMKTFKAEMGKCGSIVKKRPAGTGRSGTPTHILLGFRAV